MEGASMGMGTKEQIIEELGSLTDRQLRQVLQGIQRMKGPFSDALSGAEFVQRFGGLVSPEDAAEMLRVIEEDCENIDLDAWDLPAGYHGGRSSPSE
jgi:hypothetical protein